MTMNGRSTTRGLMKLTIPKDFLFDILSVNFSFAVIISKQSLIY